MPHNSYIKDLNRFPAGASVSLAGESDVINYRNTTNYVSLTSTTVVDDGTGLNDLVKFRLKYEDPSYIINRPTSIDFLRNFILNKTVKHKVLTGKPYSFEQFRGATAMNISFVTGNGESQPARSRKGSWGNPFKSKFWICRFLPWIGFRRDKRSCYTYTYRKDASFTVQVEGGYGDPSHLVVTLRSGNGGHISTQRPDGNGRVTFSGLWGSANDNQNPGPYIIETGDINTGYSHVTRMFVPYQPLSNTFIHSRSSAGISQSFGAGGTFSPGVNNAIWANAPGVAAPPSGDLITASIDEDDALSNCTTNRVNFTGDVDEYYSGSISWRFSFKLFNQTSWTPIGSFQSIPAASLNIPVQVSAFADIPVSDYGGNYKLELTSSTGNITIDTTPGGGVATFELLPPDVDSEWVSTNQTSTPIVTFPATTDKNYTITFNYTASSCKAFKAELLRWDGDQSGSITTNMPLSTPPSGVTVITSNMLAAGVFHNKTFTDNLGRRSPGIVFTYALRFKNTAVPFDTTIYPNFLRTASEIDPDTGATIPATENFEVVTLA
jgi:hypothetical protein